VIERPAEAQVRPRGERVVIERRPAADQAAAPASGLEENDVEVIERHEPPVVRKTARAGGEVIVHARSNDRVETVRDSVR
jgi:stress response protein YsnF